MEGTRPQGPGEAVQMRVQLTVTIPARTEAVIQCQASGLIPTDSYFLKPLRPEGAPVVPDCCCINESGDETVRVRIANTSTSPEVIGVLESGIQ